ncbi:MAG: DNA primase [Clostridia bacterium]|nr:DNA primase [Clostridia bacterium]MBR2925976.1 DNA primase [Clostridia bacterium]
MRFTDHFIQEVLDRTDIEELIGRYVTLKRSGANLWGRCPFHSEKTPSFSVSPAKRMFFCFGCHAGGSAITFVQKMENLDFPDAVELLATRAGIPLPQESAQGESGGISRRRIFEMNLEAARFFRSCLFDRELGRDGMQYFRTKRRLSDATIKHFGLGFAPNSFGALTDHMHKLGYTDEELIAACLCGKSQKTGRAYDYFRNRVMFPIIDTSGNVVAFGGRVLDDSKPKYLNSSDTPAFKKSRHLFALNFAKNYASEKMILCEGYMDVIALHQAGFENAVATLGTAITPDHARIFSKYTQRVIISYDSDEAGQNAANKAMRILGEVGMDVRVLKLANAKDPDEYIQKFGADRLRLALEESKTGFEHKAERILSKYDVSIGTDRIKASNELCAIIAEYSSPIEREVYMDAASKRIGIPVDVLRNSIEQIQRRRHKVAREKESREAQASLKNYGDRINPEASKNPRATTAEEAILGLLLIFEEYRNAVERGEVPLCREDFVTEFHRRVFDAVMSMHARETGFSPELLGADFSPDEMGRIQKMVVARQQLQQNGPAVFRSAVEVLQDVAKTSAAKEGDLNAQIAYLREKQAKLHKGKADKT